MADLGFNYGVALWIASFLSMYLAFSLSGRFFNSDIWINFVYTAHNRLLQYRLRKINERKYKFN